MWGVNRMNQCEINKLINIDKIINIDETMFSLKDIVKKSFSATSQDSNINFIFDINNSGTRKRKYTYQNRYKKSHILIRLDVNSKSHKNPDGTIVGKNHIHIAHENMQDSVAFDVPQWIIDKCPTTTFVNFLKYCNVINHNIIQYQKEMIANV